MMKTAIRWGWIWLLGACAAHGAGRPQVVFHEIAWMGVKGAPSRQWIELYNAGERAVDLGGWRIRAASGNVDEELAGELKPGHTLLLARGARPFVPGLVVHARLAGKMSAAGEELELVDAAGKRVDHVDAWHAGDASRAATMQRAHPYRDGTDPAAWQTASVRYDRGYGTPGFRMPPAKSGQQLRQVYHGPDTLTVFFNQSARTDLAMEGNEANHGIDLEERLIDRIRQARRQIDVAAYEINLEGLVEELAEQAARGVQVRLIVDAKAPEDDLRDMRYARMRVHLERLIRGLDGRVGTDDDVRVFANSPIFAVRDGEFRARHGLPADPGDDFPWTEVPKGARTVGGHLLVEGARKPGGGYYAPGGQMHNKFVVIDDYRVVTGSMNFTETDTHGSAADRQKGVLRGNANNMLDIHSPELAAIYREEFNQMWGGAGGRPEPDLARFRGNKEAGRAPHRVQLGDVVLHVYFSPGYDVLPAIASYVEENASESLYFCIFAWSDGVLDNVVKRKWEGSPLDLEGERTGFRIKGVAERLFWDQWWSATVNMTGRAAGRQSDRNPNVRWRHVPPVRRDREARKLHHKYMLIDVDAAHEPTVVTGSANWSRNANEVNDENTLFIRDRRIANQYAQEFAARFEQAGGRP